MIGSLKGVLQYRSGTDWIVDVSGVGYSVTVCVSALTQARKVGEQVELIIFTDVKENAISLFGFETVAEREVFLLLKKVKGIGSKLALGILSSLPPEALLAAIGSSDVTALSRVPGIGKKTAERLVVELREQVGEFAREVTPASLSGSIEIERIGLKRNLPQVALDALLALEKLGFAPERAQRAVTAALESPDGRRAASDAGEMLRLALKELS